MSRFATGGSVKSCMDVRIAEKWEGSEAFEGSFMASNSWWPDGPKTGPLGSTSAGRSGLSFGSAWKVSKGNSHSELPICLPSAVCSVLSARSLSAGYRGGELTPIDQACQYTFGCGMSLLSISSSLLLWYDARPSMVVDGCGDCVWSPLYTGVALKLTWNPVAYPGHKRTAK